MSESADTTPLEYQLIGECLTALTEINQMLSAVVLDGEWLKVFEVNEPIPAFRVEGASSCGKGLIAEMENAVYRGDMYRFSAKAVY